MTELKWIDEDTYECRGCSKPVDKSVPTGLCYNCFQLENRDVLIIEKLDFTGLAYREGIDA